MICFRIVARVGSTSCTVTCSADEWSPPFLRKSAQNPAYRPSGRISLYLSHYLSHCARIAKYSGTDGALVPYLPIFAINDRFFP